jgi:hypothetical protein
VVKENTLTGEFSRRSVEIEGVGFESGGIVDVENRPVRAPAHAVGQLQLDAAVPHYASRRHAEDTSVRECVGRVDVVDHRPDPEITCRVDSTVIGAHPGHLHRQDRDRGFPAGAQIEKEHLGARGNHEHIGIGRESDAAVAVPRHPDAVLSAAHSTIAMDPASADIDPVEGA